MSLRPARRIRPFTNHTPNPYETAGGSDAPAPVLQGRVLDTHPCEKCQYDLLGQKWGGKCPKCDALITPPAQPGSKAGPHIKRGVVQANKVCTGCGYNLRGLPVKNLCPECGKPIITSVRIPKHGSSISDAPLGWLRTFAVACIVFAIGGLAVLASMVVWAVTNGTIGGITICGAGVVWCIGVFLITRPRPILPGSEGDPRSEWLWWRVAALVSQPFWIVSGVIIYIDAGTVPPAPAWMFPLALTSAIMRGGGLIALFVYVANLASWAGDDDALRRARASVILGPFAVFWGVVSILASWSSYIFSMTPAVLWGVIEYTACILVPMMYLARMFFSVGQMGPWALSNHLHEQARLERLRSTAASALAAADAGREHGVVNDTAQPAAVLMPGPQSRPPGAPTADSIRPGNRRVPPKLGR